MKLWAFLLLGSSVAVSGCATGGLQGDQDRAEVKVPFGDLPASAQQTFTTEAPGQKIVQVDKEAKKGLMGYEADVKLYGRNYEIRVDPDGHLISKKIDDEDQRGGNEDKDQDHDRDEKD